MKETGDSRYVIKNAINNLVFKNLVLFFYGRRRNL